MSRLLFRSAPVSMPFGQGSSVSWAGLLYMDTKRKAEAIVGGPIWVAESCEQRTILAEL